MAERDTASIPALVRSVIDDARELIRDEIALARAEIRKEAAVMQRAGIAFGTAAVLALIGAVLFCVALGGAIAYMLGAPAWVGLGIVAILLGAGAGFFLSRGRTGLANVGALPLTRESLRENMAWIHSKSSSR